MQSAIMHYLMAGHHDPFQASSSHAQGFKVSCTCLTTMHSACHFYTSSPEVSQPCRDCCEQSNACLTPFNMLLHIPCCLHHGDASSIQSRIDMSIKSTVLCLSVSIHQHVGPVINAACCCRLPAASRVLSLFQDLSRRPRRRPEAH